MVCCFDDIDVIYLNLWCNINHLSQMKSDLVNYVQSTYPVPNLSSH